MKILTICALGLSSFYALPAAAGSLQQHKPVLVQRQMQKAKPVTGMTMYDSNRGIQDFDSANRLTAAGGDQNVTVVEYSCANFQGQPWFNDPRGIYADYNDGSIWTCAEDLSVLYKSYCPGGTRPSAGGCIGQ